ncbi:lipase member H isoform X1 [Nomia melanderi]|uniref:lipase member H isoform X1 n=2 Tax=Nomia melanderi TaxID=2448451 RepID=UPI003FCD5636
MVKLHTCLCVLLCLIGGGIVHARVCDLQNKPFIFKEVRLKVYKGDSSNFTATSTTLMNPQKIAKDIDPKKNSVLYIHGFMENTIFDNVLVVVKGFLDRGDVNVIALDWSEVTMNINYIYVSEQVVVIGKAVAGALEKLSNVIDLQKLHVVGHSLGAHIAGHIGRFVNTTLGRIIGLDPAFPLFYPSTCHVRASDAENVVILHTDAGFYGTPIDTGSVDFYANKGVSPQPGCPVIIGGEVCSHQRSTKIFAESLTNPNAFLAYECNSDTMKRIDGGRNVPFGDNTPNNLRGAFCFETNAQYPYGKASAAA